MGSTPFEPQAPWPQPVERRTHPENLSPGEKYGVCASPPAEGILPVLGDFLVVTQQIVAQMTAEML